MYRTILLVNRLLKSQSISKGTGVSVMSQLRSVRHAVFCFGLLVGAAFCLVLSTGFVAAQISPGQSVLYKKADGTETRIATVSEAKAFVSAGSGTIVHFSNDGAPDFIGFAQPDEHGQDKVQGLYGVDANDRPQNNGRLIFTQMNSNEPMQFFVQGSKPGVYNLKRLEITTVCAGSKGSRECHAFATVAVLFDNTQLVIESGRIKIGGSLIAPSYRFSGEIVR